MLAAAAIRRCCHACLYAVLLILMFFSLISSFQMLRLRLPRHDTFADAARYCYYAGTRTFCSRHYSHFRRGIISLLPALIAFIFHADFADARRDATFRGCHDDTLMFSPCSATQHARTLASATARSVFFSSISLFC